MIPLTRCTNRLQAPLLVLLLAAGSILSGCSSTKTVPEGDALFAGYQVKVNDERDSSKRGSELETELTATVRPKPNASILGMRPKLWIYNAFYTKKEKGIKHWIQTKFGEPPVLLSTVDTTSVSGVMSGRLHNKGYFVSTVESATTIKKKMATIDWTATVSEPYRIQSLKYTLSDSLPIQQAIEQVKAGSLLVPGEPYDLAKMTAERTRIDQNLKEKGFYYFSPENLIFSVDTTAGDRKADVLLRLKSDVPSYALKPYTLDDIFIFANYSLSDTLYARDTINVRGFHYVPNEDYVKARYLLRNVFLEKDSVHTRRNHLLTVNRLMGLPAYKFVNVQYERDTTSLGKLDAFIYLTPSLKKSLQAEARMVNKSNGFAGPGVTVSFRNRNALRGSELLNVELTGSFENSIGGGRGKDAGSSAESSNKNTSLSSYELGVQSTLTFPRIVSPFRLRNLRTEFVPKTRISAGFSFLNRVQYYQMNSFNASYGYNWRPKKTLTFDVTPINLQYVKLGRITADFDTILRERPYLQRSFENQFIIGSIFQVTYSNQMLEGKTNHFFNNTSLDLSGNVLNALQTLGGSPKGTDDFPRTIAKQPFSQYIRLENDFRYYLNLTKESQLVTRLAVGIGMPYGNSSNLPYVKQFSVGGPNSIRAFRARSIGPGTYDIPDSLASSYFDQVGDIKLEANIEYRFPIVGFFKGAVFVDAGNVWLANETLDKKGQPDRPGGVFKASNILNDVAIGTGFGLRVDVDFFVLRFDLGIPVKIPYLPKGEQNVLRSFEPKFGGERGMVLNIAIGYPF